MQILEEINIEMIKFESSYFSFSYFSKKNFLWFNKILSKLRIIKILSKFTHNVLQRWRSRVTGSRGWWLQGNHGRCLCPQQISLAPPTTHNDWRIEYDWQVPCAMSYLLAPPTHNDWRMENDWQVACVMSYILAPPTTQTDQSRIQKRKHFSDKFSFIKRIYFQLKTDQTKIFLLSKDNIFSNPKQAILLTALSKASLEGMCSKSMNGCEKNSGKDIRLSGSRISKPCKRWRHSSEMWKPWGIWNLKLNVTD